MVVEKIWGGRKNIYFIFYFFTFLFIYFFFAFPHKKLLQSFFKNIFAFPHKTFAVSRRDIFVPSENMHSLTKLLRSPCKDVCILGMQKFCEEHKKCKDIFFIHTPNFFHPPQLYSTTMSLQGLCMILILNQYMLQLTSFRIVSLC